MSFSSWLQNWNRSAPRARRRMQKSPRRPATFRPGVEALEGRALLAGLPYPTAATVDQLAADISYADNTGGAFTINLQPFTYFALTTGALPVVGGAKAVDLTILGYGDNGNSDTIDGLGLNRLFTVALGASLTLDNVTLQNGHFSGDGGGIYNAGGTVTISNSILAHNTAKGGNGGGIYNAGGWVTVDNSVVADNSAILINYIGGGDGAGIYNDTNGTVTIRNASSVFENLSDWHGDLFAFDVDNLGVVYQDSTSMIDALYGNPAIFFDPNTPQLQIHGASVAEGNTGVVAAEFTVTLSAASTQMITVAYATADGTATAGSDYQAASGTLNFAPGETSKTITVLVIGDRLGESNETFFVNLSAASNATIQAVGNIADDEPRINISDVTKTEGARGQTTLFVFTVALSAAYDQPVTVSFRTVKGTAKAGDDYVDKTGKLTFAPGETTKTITIEVKGDSKKETNETFYLDLFGNSSNSLLSKNRGIGAILNDD
jgi:hypothetical protein